MTTIAYKDGTIASDSIINQGTKRIGTMWKIARLEDGTLAGASGLCTGVQAFLDWFESDQEEKPPKMKGTEGFIVDPKGRIAVVENGYFEIDDRIYACGSGAAVAYGAMEAGASAKEAVKIAMKYDIHTGGTIRTLNR